MVDLEDIMLQTVEPLSRRMTNATSLSSTAWEISKLSWELTYAENTRLNLGSSTEWDMICWEHMCGTQNG
jgi:hypothetical protein